MNKKQKVDNDIKQFLAPVKKHMKLLNDKELVLFYNEVNEEFCMRFIKNIK